MKINLDTCYHSLPTKPAEKVFWQQLFGSSLSLALSYTLQHHKLLVVITPNINTSNKLAQELRFFNNELPIYTFPDWETLPYDHFSPQQDIISQRLWTLSKLPYLQHGIVLASITSLMHRLPPKEFLNTSFVLECNTELDITTLRNNLTNSGYQQVPKVIEHGEFAIRGSIIDVFPMGATVPYRIDTLDNKIESIRIFDKETQRSLKKITDICLLPAKEYPQTQEGINHFRQAWRNWFPQNPSAVPLYEAISNGKNFPGAEYYLSLFFDHTASFFDYIPKHSILMYPADLATHGTAFWHEVTNRFEQLNYNRLQPLLPPVKVFIPVNDIGKALQSFPQVVLNATKKRHVYTFNIQELPDLCVTNPTKLQTFTQNLDQVLFCCESPGRQENLLELLKNLKIYPTRFSSWHDFYKADAKFGITVAPLETGLYLTAPKRLALITEPQLFGEQTVLKRSRHDKKLDIQAMVRDLTELQIGAPVVHIEHGIGRYLGLQILPTDAEPREFLTIAYADDAKLYVPVTSLHLIARYSGIDAEHAPLHHLGSKQWEKAKQEAHAKIYDTAAELLKIYAVRSAETGSSYTVPPEYQEFADSFPFATTLDQERAIQDVINDLKAPKPMDRLICGDVGFGKTEVAMRAAFIAVFNQKQVAILAPTTILAEQHYNNFQDRLAKWPLKIAMLSRFSKTQMSDITTGKFDIIIGTHKLLNPQLHFKELGLLIIDEEHRFGVRQKEHLKKLGPNIDILTLTATPIPRTLNMAFANIRDFSIIATPPAKRLAIKTFVHETNTAIIREAILREILRGGQVFFLHNKVSSITKSATDLQALVPEAKIAIAHGQMRELQLEQVMRDFYLLRSNVLVCTTIIESGIDIPTANTIIIDRADLLGLAQLHQLRGRVGRSHHQAYAYLLIPPFDLLTPDAQKRLQAIANMEDLGAGFYLATHDLEIRGAGELLGAEQSGQIQNIGFSLYMELLEKATQALKENCDFTLTQPDTLEIDLHLPALIPDTYLDDVSMRLVFYKRIANAKNLDALADLAAEMFDRFGPLQPATQNLFKITELKLQAQPLGIRKITAGTTKGTIEFLPNTNVNPQKLIQLIQKTHSRMRGPHTLEFIPQDPKITFIANLLQQLY